MRDWSWQRTRRRLGLLVRLALPYRGRTALSLATLLAYTVVALAPPYLAKLAIDQGIKARRPQPADLDHRALPRRRGARARPVRREHVPDRLGRRTRPRRPPEQALRAPGAAVARLLRAQPRRRRDQPDHERRRGARPARHRRRHEPDPEHAAPGRHGRRPLPARLAARAGDADGADPDGARHGLVPQPLEPRLPPRPRAPRPRDGDARRGHRWDARRPVVHARAGAAEGLPRRQRPLPGRELRDDGPERDLLPRRRPARDGGDRDRLRLRRLARLPRRDDRGHALRLRALSLELLRPDPAAVAALQHVPLRDRGARQDHRRPRRGAAGRRPRRGRVAGAGSTAASTSRTSASATAPSSPRSCTGSSSTCLPGRPWRWWGTRAPASRRSRS